jgi:hypothetical protein
MDIYKYLSWKFIARAAGAPAGPAEANPGCGANKTLRAVMRSVL